MIGLTPRMENCLDAIRSLSEAGVSPTVAEIRDYLGASSKGGVHDALLRLKSRGIIDWKPRQARSIYVVEDKVAPRVLAKLSDDALRSTIAHAAGILAQRVSARATQGRLARVASKLPCGRRAS